MAIIDFLNSKHKNFDKLDKFKKYYQNILYPKCEEEIFKTFSRAGILYKNAMVESVKQALKDLQVDAVKSCAFRIALVTKYMLDEIDTYEAGDLFILDHNATLRASIAFEHLFSLNEQQNSFENVYKNLRELVSNEELTVEILNKYADVAPEQNSDSFKKVLENAINKNNTNLQFDFLARSMGSGSVKHIKQLMQDLNMDDEALLLHAYNGLPIYGALLYGLSEGNEEMANVLLKKLGWANQDNAEYLMRILHVNLREDNLEAVELLMKIDCVKEIIMGDMDIILEAAGYMEDHKIIADKPYILHLIELAMEFESEKVLKFLLQEADPKAINKSLIKAIQDDSAEVFAELVKESEEDLLAFPDTKFALFYNAMLHNASESMQKFSNEFLKGALLGGLQELETRRQNSSLEDYASTYKEVKLVFSNIFNLMNQDTINEIIAQDKEELLQKILYFEGAPNDSEANDISRRDSLSSDKGSEQSLEDSAIGSDSCAESDDDCFGYLDAIECLGTDANNGLPVEFYTY